MFGALILPEKSNVCWEYHEYGRNMNYISTNTNCGFSINFVLFARVQYALLLAATVSFQVWGTTKLTILLYLCAIAILIAGQNNPFMGYLFPDLYNPLETRPSYGEGSQFGALFYYFGAILIFLVLGLLHSKKRNLTIFLHFLFFLVLSMMTTTEIRFIIYFNMICFYALLFLINCFNEFRKRIFP
jgi:hypothetical protein